MIGYIGFEHMRGKTYHQMNINEWLLFLVAKTYKSGRLISLTKAFKKRPISNFRRKKESKDKKEENLKKKREKGKYHCLENKSF